MKPRSNRDGHQPPTTPLSVVVSPDWCLAFCSRPSSYQDVQVQLGWRPGVSHPEGVVCVTISIHARMKMPVFNRKKRTKNCVQVIFQMLPVYNLFSTVFMILPINRGWGEAAQLSQVIRVQNVCTRIYWYFRKCEECVCVHRQLFVAHIFSCALYLDRLRASWLPLNN